LREVEEGMKEWGPAGAGLVFLNHLRHLRAS
jgi:hypothetical protein